MKPKYSMNHVTVKGCKMTWDEYAKFHEVKPLLNQDMMCSATHSRHGKPDLRKGRKGASKRSLFLSRARFYSTIRPSGFHLYSLKHAVLKPGMYEQEVKKVEEAQAAFDAARPKIKIKGLYSPPKPQLAKK